MGSETSKILDEESKKWFNSLQKNDQILLTKACRHYAYHFDGYLNSIYKNAKFPYLQLIEHARDVYYKENHDVFNEILYNEFKNDYCNSETLKSPFKSFIEKPIRLSEFVAKIKDVTRDEIHNIFTDRRFSFVLTEALVVYRGLKIGKNATFIPELKGITSVATIINKSLDFAFPPSEPFDARVYKSIILQITLPAGTRVIPMNICTIQNEYEVIILTQGTLKLTKPSSFVDVKMWNDFINDKGEFVKVQEGGGSLPYELMKVEFIKTEEFPTYNSFRVSPRVTPRIIEDLEESKEDGGKKIKNNKKKSPKK